VHSTRAEREQCLGSGSSDDRPDAACPSARRAGPDRVTTHHSPVMPRSAKARPVIPQGANFRLVRSPLRSVSSPTLPSSISPRSHSPLFGGAAGSDPGSPRAMPPTRSPSRGVDRGVPLVQGNHPPGQAASRDDAGAHGGRRTGAVAPLRILRTTLRAILGMVIHAGLRAMRPAVGTIGAAIAHAMPPEKPLPNRCF